MNVINRTNWSEEEFVEVERLYREQFDSLISRAGNLIENTIITEHGQIGAVVAEFHPTITVTDNHLYQAIAKVVDKNIFISHALIIAMIKILRGDTNGVQTRIDPFGIICHEFGHILNNYTDDELVPSTLVLEENINHHFPIVLNEYLAESFATKIYYNDEMLRNEIDSCISEVETIKNEVVQINEGFRNGQHNWQFTMNQNLNYCWMVIIAISKVLGIENNIRENPHNLSLRIPELDTLIQELKTMLSDCETTEVPLDLCDNLYSLVIRVCESFGCQIEVNESTRFVLVRSI